MSKSPRLARSGRRRAAGRVVALSAASLVAITGFAGQASAAGGFSPDGLVVYRVGSGTAALSSAATPVFLDEYATTPSTSPSFSLSLPSTGTPNLVTASGTATSEGELTLSTDATTLVATGYNVAAGTAGVAATTSSATANQRVVATVDANGTIDATTAFSSLYSGNNIRSAASSTGSTLYTGGPTNGVAVATHGATTGTQLTTASNFRQTAIFGGQLYASTGSAPTGIYAIGSGLPTGATSATLLSGIDSGTGSSPYGFVLFNETGGAGPDTAYVADSTGKILKYGLVGGTWTAEGSASLSGATGLTGTYLNGVATLYATSPSSLVSITDSNGQTGTLTAAPLTLATAAANEVFRGVALAPSSNPVPTLPEAPLAIILPLSAVALVGASVLFLRRRRPNTA